METLKQKLSSRKLWMAVLAAVMCIIAAGFGDELTADAVALIETAAKAAVAYIFGESVVDIFRKIADAIKEKYAIPSAKEIISDCIAAEKELEAEADNPPEES